ncbi:MULTISPECIES: outer membrane protein [unclassified Bradyrhizobium]|uniref:outer membrane protein n=1 Tax=unclassified Bradyrhizobium TaxID=2631580 RepID=UPI001FF789E7|nr:MULTISPECIES: outer membrane protein [unclassified Bradyrhizobium]MCK1418869.1 porin family protein [Bradyrhizobium sp. CW4]MCK1437486.1 porin family protein [Bradyrhizobium sp. 15]MCK1554540.1 porin family protein [Bradyrhizobium sp. 177]MCK1661835.1 porin family protein [Bradyrhizobium sp. 151]
MKKLLLAATSMMVLSLSVPASAADMAARPYTKAPVAPVVAVYNWSGFYVGGHIGWGWGEIDNTSAAPGTVAFPTGTPLNRTNSDGFLGGVQGGFNWQYNSLVLGIEGEYTWSDIKGTSTTTSIVAPAVVTTSTAHTDDIAMVTGRVGWAANEWLFYGKGGWAWGHGHSNGLVTVAGAPFSNTSTSNNRDGWVVGAGVEWGFAPNWSAKVEYNHIDFGSNIITVNQTVGAATFVDSSTKIDLVKAGVNYRFNWGGPGVTRY